MSDLNLASLNVRGLGNCQKRREIWIFNWLRAKGFSIFFLQETHGSEKSVPIWLAEWGYKDLFNSCNTAYSATLRLCYATAILFNNNFSFKLECSFTAPEDWFIIYDIKLDRKVIILTSTYAPNEDNPQFLGTFEV